MPDLAVVASGQSEGTRVPEQEVPEGARGGGLVPVLRSSESGTPGVGFGGYLQGGVVRVAKLTIAATRRYLEGCLEFAGRLQRGSDGQADRGRCCGGLGEGLFLVDRTEI